MDVNEFPWKVGEMSGRPFLMVAAKPPTASDLRFAIALLELCCKQAERDEVPAKVRRDMWRSEYMPDAA